MQQDVTFSYLQSKIKKKRMLICYKYLFPFVPIRLHCEIMVYLFMGEGLSPFLLTEAADNPEVIEEGER